MDDEWIPWAIIGCCGVGAASALIAICLSFHVAGRDAERARAIHAGAAHYVADPKTGRARFEYVTK